MSNDTITVTGNRPPNIPVGPGMSGGGGGFGPGVPQHGTLKDNPDFKIISTNNGVFDANGDREKSHVDAENGYLPLNEEVITATRPHNANGPYRLVIVDTPVDKVEERLNVIGEIWKQGQPRFILKNKTAIDFNSFDDLYKFVHRSKQQGKGGKNHSKSAEGWAPPLIWGPWVDLASHHGADVYTVSFDTLSEAPSSFDVQIEYAASSRMILINTMGPGSYQITDNHGAGTDRIRFKSHSGGQVIRIEY